MDGLARDRELLHWALRQPAVSPHKWTARAPDFLIISPPKTGSTWLADNLRHHPALFLPAIKEVKYFSCFYRWLDLNWYLDHFAEGEGRVKGEASPSYAILPVERIALLRQLFPHLKLIFLMRDPIARAWSHARHNHKYREINFAGCTAPFAHIAEEQWRENFVHPWALASGDYLGQVRHWLSVFPRHQVFVDCYERIATEPEALLRDVFTFLGVPACVALDGFPLRDRILEGPPGALTPALAEHLHGLFHARTRALADYLREQFALRPPAEWQRVLGPASHAGVDFEALDFSEIVRLEESFPSAARGVVAGHRGYEIVCHQGRLFAWDQALGAFEPSRLDAPALEELRRRGHCFIGHSLAEVIEQVDEHLFQRGEEQRRALQQRDEDLRQELAQAREQLTETRERLARLEVGVGEVIAALNEARGELARVSSFRYWAQRAWRSARRRFVG